MIRLSWLIASMLMAPVLIVSLLNSEAVSSVSNAASEVRGGHRNPDQSGRRESASTLGAMAEGTYALLQSPRAVLAEEASHKDLLADANLEERRAAAIARSAQVSVQTVEDMVYRSASEFGADALAMRRVLWCESKNDTEAVGDGGRSIGIAQYQARTYQEHARLSGLGYTLADYGDPAVQIRLMAWAFGSGKAGAWSCK